MRLRISKKLDQIADEEVAKYFRHLHPDFANSEEARSDIGKAVATRASKECGSFVSMILWAILSSVIQAAIKRWIENRQKKWGFTK